MVDEAEAVEAGVGLSGERERVVGLEEGERWVEDRGRRGVGTGGEMGEGCKCFVASRQCSEVGGHQESTRIRNAYRDNRAPFHVNRTALR